MDIVIDVKSISCLIGRQEHLLFHFDEKFPALTIRFTTRTTNPTALFMK